MVKKKRLQSGTWEACEDPWMRKAFASDPTCDRPVFMDVGMAFGYYSIRALQSPCRHVHAFNPHPRFLDAAKSNVEDNLKAGSLVNSRICINQVAVSDHRGTVNFAFGYDKGITRNGLAGVQVPMMSLDDYVASFIPNSTQILMVKLDVEGEEVRAMKGAAQLLKDCRVKYWAIGIHNPGYVKPIVGMLEQHGYTIEAAGACPGQPNWEILAHC